LENEDSITQPAKNDVGAGVHSLKDLLNIISGKDFVSPEQREDAGIAESIPFPFLALVGQNDMKLALILALINPAVGGVLLIGPRGTGKTTAVRSLIDLLPYVPRSLCYYGCLPEDIDNGGIDAVCPDCAKKYAQGEPLAKLDRVRLVELPLNAELEDVVGGIDERAIVHDRMRLRRGLLAQSDRNMLYVDEVNLLSDDVVNALLDASALGSYTVRRGPVSATYWSRFVLVGSMNPEEGKLRPQILDRFGLRVIVRGLEDTGLRFEAYKRVHAFLMNRRQSVQQFAVETDIARDEIQSARDLLSRVVLPSIVAEKGLSIINDLGIDSLRAEITLFEAARAHAAADARDEVTITDLETVTLMALRLRRSHYIEEFFAERVSEDNEIGRSLDGTITKDTQGDGEKYT
jgi:magnesium chelatase subunit I